MMMQVVRHSNECYYIGCKFAIKVIIVYILYYMYNFVCSGGSSKGGSIGWAKPT